jgi:hypothetical protein
VLPGAKAVSVRTETDRVGPHPMPRMGARTRGKTVKGLWVGDMTNSSLELAISKHPPVLKVARTPRTSRLVCERGRKFRKARGRSQVFRCDDSETSQVPDDRWHAWPAATATTEHRRKERPFAFTKSHPQEMSDIGLLDEAACAAAWRPCGLAGIRARRASILI